MQVLDASLPSDFHLTSHGHCYQSLIVQAFAKAGIEYREIDKYVNYLTEFSYFLFRRGNGYISDEEFDRFANEYSNKYLISSHADAVNGLIKSGILTKDDDDNLRFSYKYVYYFYCAKYMSDNYSRMDVQKIVAELCQKIFLEENANIIIFMCHHSKDQKLVDEILLNTMMRFSGTRESTLAPEETVHFFEYEELIPKLVIEERNIREQRKKVLDNRDRLELELAKLQTKVNNNNLETGGDADEPDDADTKAMTTFYQEFHSSLRSVEIVGQILHNRFGSFEKAQLKGLAEEGINVGLRVMKQTLQLTSDGKVGIIEIIRQVMSQNEKFSNEEVVEKAKAMYLTTCYWMTVILLDAISNCMGASELAPIYKELLSEHRDSTAYGLIYIAIEMHASKRIPKSEIARLYREVALDPIARRMLRQLVLRFLYMNHIDYRDKQWLSHAIGLPIKQQLLADKSSVEQKPTRPSEAALQ
jgi:hypothetical protein